MIDECLGTVQGKCQAYQSRTCFTSIYTHYDWEGISIEVFQCRGILFAEKVAELNNHTSVTRMLFTMIEGGGILLLKD